VKGLRSGRLFDLLLFLIAFAIRFEVARVFAGEAVWDGHYYDLYARRIAGGHGYSDPMVVAGVDVGHASCHYPVGYSGFLGLFYAIFGASRLSAQLFNALVGALLPVVVWRVAAFGLSNVRARAAGILAAIHPGLVLYAALTMSEPLSALLTLSAFYLFLRGRAEGRPLRGAILGALVLGVAALVRPQALLCVPFLVPFAPFPRFAAIAGAAGGRLSAHGAWAGRTLATALLLGAISLLPVLPWTVRNCKQMDGCALVSTNGGWNLAIGAFPRATGRFETLKSSDGCSDVTGQVQQDRCWFAYGLSHIRKTPLRWLELVPKKWAYTFDHESFQVEYLHQATPEQWPDGVRSNARTLLSAFHQILVAVAALSVVGLRLRGKPRPRFFQGALLVLAVLAAYLGLAHEPPSVVPLVAFLFLAAFLPLPGSPAMTPPLLLSLGLLGTVLFTHAVFFGEDRYHIVVSPIFCILAAAALRTPEDVPSGA
jgi:4-amino-4-deoxy-L-arabinose transferase-like glycosyltransferase